MVLECKHVWEHISGYLDGNLDAAVLEEVQKDQDITNVRVVKL